MVEESNLETKPRIIVSGCQGNHAASSSSAILGLTIVKQVTAQLVHCFDWELPEGMLPTELDMTEEFSLVTPWTKHLLAIPSYCLNI
ncbi:hypothetical protein WN943_023744 [Citrus x changshan-huyou]